MDDILSALPDAIVLADSEGRVVFVNDALCELLGYAAAELVGQPIEVLVPESMRSVHVQQRGRYLESPRRRTMGERRELSARRKDGTELPVHISLGPLATARGRVVVAAIRDMSERRALDEQLRQAQKMEAVGQLAGGVAHDFNNLLSVILGYSAILVESLPRDHPISLDLGEIHQAALRARDLTRQLLAFSRKQVFQLEVLDPNVLLSRMARLLGTVVGEHVALSIEQGSTGAVKVDRAQLEQVIVNLVVNARDAMPDGGRLVLTTSNVVLDDARESAHRGVAPGRFVEIRVADTGVGMDETTRARVFEPFFTTKDVGQGTGLGLSTVFGTVRQSGGTVWVDSQPGAGATFHVLLPESSEPGAAPAPAEEPLPSSRVLGTVLLVEDDDQVRRLAVAILRGEGFDVIEARGARDATEKLEAYQGRIDLLLTDVVMPGMSGKELADAVTAARPGVRVLYMSGYAETAVVERGVLDPAVSFVAKPLTPELLVDAVRRVLA